MKKLLGLLLFSTVVLAQSVPNGTIVQGQIWTPAQWNNAWQAKTDYPTYPRTAIEISAGVVPINFSYPPGHAWRYGVDPTNVTDTTLAMIIAHSTGYLIYYPGGTYKMTSGISIPCGGIRGDGPFQTIFNSVSVSSANLFNYSCAANSQASGVFQDFGVESASMTGGYGLTITAPSGEAFGTRITNILMSGLPNGISFIAASRWSITNSQFLQTTGDAITVNNTNNADSGDSVIGNSYFSSTSTVTTDVHQIESGGLRLIGNKFNGFGIGYLLDLGATSTSDLLVNGNSYENGQIAAIKLQRLSGSAIFANVEITGNQFLDTSISNTSVAIFSVPASAFLSNVAVSGNVIQHNDTGVSQGINLDFVTNAQISANTLTGAGGSSTGILIGTHGSNITVGIDNNVTGFGTNFSGTTSVNGLVVGNATGGSQGVGTLNATQLYNAGSLVPAVNQTATWTANHTFNSDVAIAPASGVALTVTSVSAGIGEKINVTGAGTGVQILTPAATTTTVFSTTQSGQSGWFAQLLASTNNLIFTTGSNEFKLFGAGGINVGAPTGGDKGLGALNAVTLWQNGVALAASATTDTTNATNISSGTVATARLPASSVTLAGTSGSIGGGALIAGQCASGTATVTSATTSMVALADPNTYPGDGTVWDAQVTSANTVTVKVCAIIALTPTSSTYNVRVLQ